MEDAKPQKEHEWLHKLVGEWTYEGEAVGEPDKPAHKFSGTEKVRSIGGLWVVCEGTGQMPDGSPAQMIMTLGFDPRTNRFVGTWLGSMMTHLWIYDGALDPSGMSLPLDSKGPSFTNPTEIAPYRDVITFTDDDHRTLTGNAPGPDGTWQPFMTCRYTRVK